MNMNLKRTLIALAIATLTVPAFAQAVDEGTGNTVDPTGVGIGNGVTAGANSIAIGTSANAGSPLGSIAVGDGALATGNDSQALGNGARSTGGYATATGPSSTASSTASTANGWGATASNTNTTAIGAQSGASGSDSTSVGAYSVSSAVNGTSVGESAISTGSNSTAIGANSTATSGTSVGAGSKSIGNGTALGQYANASSDSVSLGTNATTTGTNSVALGYGSNDLGRSYDVDIGNRTLSSLAAGTMPTDAVNLGQVSQLAAVLGASYSATGSLVLPTYTMSSGTYNSVGAAFTALDTRTTALETIVSSTSSSSGYSSSTATAPATGTSGTSSTALPSTTTLSTAQQTEVQSIAANQAGLVGLGVTHYVDSSEAIMSTRLNNRIDSVDQHVNSVDLSARRGIASVAAMSSISAPYLAPGKTALVAGTALYRATGALAIGLSHMSDNGRINVSFGVSSSGGNSTIIHGGGSYIF